MIRPAGETRGVELLALAGDDVAETGIEGVGEPLGVTLIDASGTGLIVSKRDHVSSGPPPFLWLSQTRKATNERRLIRTISRALVRWRAAHLMNSETA